jgi:hypothetical protein
MLMTALALASAALLGAHPIIGAQDAAARATFSVCASQVEQVAIRARDDRFVVTIQLTPKASEEWAALTREQLTHPVRVKVGSVLLVEAEVRTPVASGLIEVARTDRGSAEDLQSIVQAAPESPCGADGRRVDGVPR